MSKDNGFTLIELMVVTVLMSVVGALALGTLQGYARAQDHQGTADEVVSVLRTTAQRSLSEGRTYCVYVNAASETWTVYRSACGATGTQVLRGTARRDADMQVGTFATPVADRPCPAAGSCVYFYPRGTATPGELTVTNGGSSITVKVEGLSSRVSRS